MPHSTLYMLMPLIVLLTWAAAQDLRERKIRNWLTLALMLTGLAHSLMPGAAIGLREAFLGLLAGFGATIVLHLLGTLGAGDVKLLAGIGAWTGAPAIFAVLLLTALAGGVLIIAQCLWQRRLILLLQNSIVIAGQLLVSARRGALPSASAGSAAPSVVAQPFPYAVPIWLGTMLTLFTPLGQLILPGARP